MGKQVISKQRVTDHGEVYTGKQELNAMLDLVKQETESLINILLEDFILNFPLVVVEMETMLLELSYLMNSS